MNVHDLCGPDPRPMTCDEVDELGRIAKALGDHPVIVQIGADQGVSTCAIVQACPGAHVFSVDRGPCDREFENLDRCGLGRNNVVRLLGDSSTIGQRWPERFKIHMLFIDGDHSEQGVRKDIAAWRPHVNSGEQFGVIAFHDYIPEPIPAHIKGRVVRAVDSEMAGYQRIGLVDRLISFRNK